MRKMLSIGVILICFGLVTNVISMTIEKNQMNGFAKLQNAQYANSVNFDEVMQHLTELQNIADGAGGNRAVRTVGFNRTLDYITNYLKTNTNFNVKTNFFYLRTFQLLRNPTLSSTIDGVSTTHIYSTNLATADFYHPTYTMPANLVNVAVTAIPNLGCTDADWRAAVPVPSGIVAVVKRGDCTFEMKATLAHKYNVAALLIYNDGTTSANLRPIAINLGQNNRVPALVLSYSLGNSLATAASTLGRTVTVRLVIETDTNFNPVGNICADTVSGDPTQTIVIGSHSDSVTAGPGINDNGSGTAGNLALAATLSRLLQNPDYIPYQYRIRFCWWGAEELGLLGADFHVKEAVKSTEFGERIGDYLVNINLDMIGSPNFIFGIYDGKTASASTPAVAKPGSNKMTDLFRTWFNESDLPWDYTGFDGRSDYGPFLAAGVCAGGLFTGADALKTTEQRTRYAAKLGSQHGGTAGIRQDKCYHQACDRTTNINAFALEKMVRASAHGIETLGRTPNLKSWLYPAREIIEYSRYAQKPQFEYNSINEYFGYPYN